MQHLIDKMYDEQPARVTVTPTIVDVVTSCVLTEEKDPTTGEVSHKYNCSIDRYTPTEYIEVLQKQVNENATSAEDVQNAVCEESASTEKRIAALENALCELSESKQL